MQYTEEYVFSEIWNVFNLIELLKRQIKAYQKITNKLKDYISF